MSSNRRLVMPFDELLASKPLRENLVGAWCMTCQKPADKEEIVDEKRGRQNSMTYRVSCHSAEEVGVFEFGSEHWGYDDIRRARQRRRWFDPNFGMGNVIGDGS